MKQHTYIAIDLKSFYASVECRERGLDPLDTNLVVADESRTDKTICLAVTPSLKSYGISGRGRLFEVKQRVKEANAGRQHDAPGHRLDGTSHFFSELQADPSLAIDFIIAPPRMAYYMEYSTRIYQVYLKYIAPEDIVVYSIDEVFMDVTDYLNTYKLSAHDLAMKIILDVLETTGITATAGIGTNLFLCKVAMDIVAKHIPADKNGVRIAELDETKFRRELWSHQPLTDFWRVGRGIAKKLEQNGMFTNNMGAAMAPSAFETIRAHFDDLGAAPEDFDLIVTGDLGKVGKEILLDQFHQIGVRLEDRYTDCGVLVFDLEGQDVHAGGSGCGCSAIVLCGYLLNQLSQGKLHRILFCGTGALLSPTSSQQGESIPGVCHAVSISTEGK